MHKAAFTHSAQGRFPSRACLHVIASGSDLKHV